MLRGRPIGSITCFARLFVWLFNKL